MEETRKCRVCLQIKPLPEMGTYRDQRTGERRPRLMCDACCKDSGRRSTIHWRTANRDEMLAGRRRRRKEQTREKKLSDNRRWNLKRLYGMTLEDYGRRFEQQEGRCAICARPGVNYLLATGRRRTGFLVVDHDHTSGRVRALLCSKCNCGIGQFNDDPHLVDKALMYLRMKRST